MQDGQTFEDVCRGISANPDADCAAVHHTATDVFPWLQVAGAIVFLIVISGVIWMVVWQARRAKSATRPETYNPTDDTKR